MTVSVEAVFSLVERELWIVSAAAGTRRGGLAATWVSPASIDPAVPLVLVALAANHFTTSLVEQSGVFAAHLLAEEQHALAWNFAHGSGRDRDKWAGLVPRRAVTGAPLLPDCLAWLDCRVLDRYPAGDRCYFWAEVCAGEQVREGRPLGASAFFAAASAEQRVTLRASLAADLQVQTPLRDVWLARCRTVP